MRMGLKQFQCFFALLLLLGPGPVLALTPLEQAQRRVEATFSQKPNARLELDEAVFQQPWNAVPFDQAAFTYSFDEIKAKWPQLMRGLKIPYPSEDYLAQRYRHFPDMMRDLGYQDDDWRQHSLNVLETWQAFFRGDFQKARNLGIRYGGYAQVPGIFAQIVYAQYLVPGQREKQMLLQDAINRIEMYGKATPFLPHETAFRDDYVLFRLGLAYAVGRLAEDVPVPVMLRNGYGPLVINAAAEAMAVNNEHPMILALNAAFDANVIRRVGKTAGKLTFGAQQEGAVELLQRSIEAVPDVAITQYEYANALLYVQGAEVADQAMAHLDLAVAAPAAFSMEALDAMYAQRRKQEIQMLLESGKNFRAFDKARRKFMAKTGANLYCVTCEPFNL